MSIYYKFLSYFRHEDPQAMERYVIKEFQNFSEANKDPLYDTIDESIFHTSVNLANKVPATSPAVTVPIASSHGIPVPTVNHTRNGIQREQLPAIPRLPDRSHSEATGDVQVNEVPLMYEEPVSLRNSVSLVGNVAGKTGHFTGTQQARTEPTMEAQYSLLEECTTKADDVMDDQQNGNCQPHSLSPSLNHPGKSNDAGHVYAVLEPSSENTTLHETA